MNLNADLIRARCTEIEDSIQRLERFQSLTKPEFLSDQDTLDLACYRLLVAIEAALALCYHISARRLRRVPEEYAQCFEQLSDAGMIPADLKERLQKMARFRNLLVHVYWKIDYEKVYEVIHCGLQDLRDFATSVVRLL